MRFSVATLQQSAELQLGAQTCDEMHSRATVRSKTNRVPGGQRRLLPGCCSVGSTNLHSGLVGSAPVVAGHE